MPGKFYKAYVENAYPLINPGFSSFYLTIKSRIDYSSKPELSLVGANIAKSPPKVDFNISSITWPYKVNPVPENIRKLNASVYIRVVFEFLLLCPSIFFMIIGYKILSRRKMQSNNFTNAFSTGY